MERARLPDTRMPLVVLAGLLFGLLACSAPAGPPAADQSGDLAALKQQVGDQATRIAALETRIALPQPTAAPPPRAAAAPTAPARPTVPSPTVIPAVASLAVDQRVREEAEESQKRGVTGTPTFFENDTKLVGAQPFEVFKAAIENALKGQQ